MRSWVAGLIGGGSDRAGDLCKSSGAVEKNKPDGLF